ncbi:MAG: hypothetical protein V1750_03875 [Acidobacteriota bacterium]
MPAQLGNQRALEIAGIRVSDRGDDLLLARAIEVERAGRQHLAPAKFGNP